MEGILKYINGLLFTLGGTVLITNSHLFNYNTVTSHFQEFLELLPNNILSFQFWFRFQLQSYPRDPVWPHRDTRSHPSRPGNGPFLLKDQLPRAILLGSQPIPVPLKFTNNTPLLLEAILLGYSQEILWLNKTGLLGLTNGQFCSRQISKHVLSLCKDGKKRGASKLATKLARPETDGGIGTISHRHSCLHLSIGWGQMGSQKNRTISKVEYGLD